MADRTSSVVGGQQRSALLQDARYALQRKRRHIRDDGRIDQPGSKARKVDEVLAHKLFIGGLGPKASEYLVLKLIKPFGTLKRMDFRWHTDGPKMGEPMGHCFVEFTEASAARKAKEKLSGRRVFRDSAERLVVRFATEEVACAESAQVESDDEGDGGGLDRPAEPAAPAESAESVDSKMDAIRRKLLEMEKSD